MFEVLSVVSTVSAITLIILVPTLLFKTIRRVEELEKQVAELKNK